MNPSHHPSGEPLLLSVAAAILTIGFGAVAYAEAVPFLAAGSTISERTAALADGRLVEGFSTRSEKLVLSDCRTAVNSIHGLTRIGVERQELLASCSAIAKRIAAGSPANALAFLLAAELAAAMGDDGAGRDRALLHSQLTAPFELQLVAARVELAEAHLDGLSATARAAHDLDLLVLAGSPRGRRLLAERYGRDPGFRERIVALLEQSPPADQKAVLAELQAALVSGAPREQS